MDRKEWKKRIEEACKDANTYKPYFDSVIDTLAIIMEARDSAQAEFEADGCLATVEYTNKAGATNVVKNPALKVVDDLNKTALAYWRDLGLTPAGLKRLGESSLTVQKGSTFEEVLAEIGI